MTQRSVLLAVCLCMPAVGEPASLDDALEVDVFSSLAPGDHLPDGWELVLLNPDAGP